MAETRTYNLSLGLKSKIRDYGLLIKFKLSLTVVFSAVMAYLIVGGASVTLIGAFSLFISGMLITGAANALNQVLEKDFDALMERTKERPVVKGRISPSEAVLAAGLMSLIGITILGLFNPLAAFLGMLSLVLYAFLYTPLKRFSSVAVIVGTLPGALPVLIGAVAIQGYISTLALIIFIIQVLWQMPHFFAIGWLGFEDYQKAGYKMLPTRNQRLDPKVGLIAFFTAVPLIILGMVPYLLGLEINLIASILVTIMGVVYSYFAWLFYINSGRKSARQLMFCSFLYLPVILFSFYLGILI